MGKIYFYDFIDQRRVIMEKCLTPLDEMECVACDERNMRLYLSGGDGKMMSVNVWNVLPIEYVKYRFICGYMRNEMDMNVDKLPVELYDMIMKFFGCQFEPSSQF